MSAVLAVCCYLGAVHVAVDASEWFQVFCVGVRSDLVVRPLVGRSGGAVVRLSCCSPCVAIDEDRAGAIASVPSQDWYQ